MGVTDTAKNMIDAFMGLYICDSMYMVSPNTCIHLFNQQALHPYS